MTTRTAWIQKLHARQPHAGLAGGFYTRELFQFELKAIYYREWLFVAHTAGTMTQGLSRTASMEVSRVA